MASKRTVRERSIAFYEIVESEQAAEVRTTQLDWEAMLAALSRAEFKDRQFESEHVFIGAVVTYQEQDHLLLHRVKDQTEWLSTVNWESEVVAEVEDWASRGYLETSVISFLPFGNVVAVMKGSTTAPSHKSLETWLNGLELFPGRSLKVRPVVSHAEIERLRTATGASKAEIRIGTSKAAALENRHGRLSRFLRMANEEYGDVNVTLTLSVPPGNTRAEERQALLNDLQELETVMPSAAERASAVLVYGDSSSGESRRVAEFVEHDITAKRKVPAVNEQGESVKIESAVNVMLEVADDHDHDLRVAVDALEGD
ncbi:hypothetical protein [Actinomycetospora soli]|uniref:hypothetical protein n=1 Tax=Actinomycetospora soli TaxID=2893887 RepID=UPI001E3D7A31|nr:hypothetical protein [Actinomycetospora soli]MCD2191613.1 hypothetical protein [Actinomycetospora soli]